MRFLWTTCKNLLMKPTGWGSIFSTGLIAIGLVSLLFICYYMFKKQQTLESQYAVMSNEHQALQLQVQQAFSNMSNDMDALYTAARGAVHRSSLASEEVQRIIQERRDATARLDNVIVKTNEQNKVIVDDDNDDALSTVSIENEHEHEEPKTSVVESAPENAATPAVEPVTTPSATVSMSTDSVMLNIPEDTTNSSLPIEHVEAPVVVEPSIPANMRIQTMPAVVSVATAATKVGRTVKGNTSTPAKRPYNRRADARGKNSGRGGNGVSSSAATVIPTLAEEDDDEYENVGVNASHILSTEPEYPPVKLSSEGDDVIEEENFISP